MPLDTAILYACQRVSEAEGNDLPPAMVARAGQKLSGYKNIRLLSGCVADFPTEACYLATTLLLVLYFVPDG
jgi:hypothetical protein